MSIYESLRTGTNDFGSGDRFHGYASKDILIRINDEKKGGMQ